MEEKQAGSWSGTGRECSSTTAQEKLVYLCVTCMKFCMRTDMEYRGLSSVAHFYAVSEHEVRSWTLSSDGSLQLR